MQLLRRVDDIPAGVPIFVYGAGEGGLTLQHAIRRQGSRTIAGFIDTYKSGQVGETRIYKLDEFLAERPANALVIIASQYVHEIASQLQDSGIDDFVIGHPLAMSLIEARRRRRAWTIVGVLVAVPAMLVALLLA